jgi:hypothetical protein
MPHFPRPARMFDLKGLYIAFIGYSHKASASILASKVKIGWFLTNEWDGFEDFSFGRHFHNFSFAPAGDIQVSHDIATHSIQTTIGKLM